MEFNTRESWLFSDNKQLQTGVIVEPVNKDEILKNLRQKYQVYTVPASIRIPIGALLIALALLMSIFILYLIDRIFTLSLDFWTGLHHTMLATFTFLVTLGCIIFARRFLLPRWHSVRSDWEQLSNHGMILSGHITDSQPLSMNATLFTYEFNNPDTELITGKYFHDYVHQSSNADLMQWLESLSSSPTEVKIWYVTDNIHTLL